MKRALGAWALALWALCGALPARAATDAGRERRLELALIAGDARQLVEPAKSARRREGLSERVRSGLGTLAIEARQAAQADGRGDPQLAAALGELSGLFTAGKLPEFAQAAAQLAAAYPLDLSYFEPLAATAPRIEKGGSIYRRYCIGCHASPDPRAANPAPDLFRTARTEPRAEFLARLLGGIHGDRATTLENPFSDEELASLAAYFLAGKDRPPASGSKR